MDGKILRAPFPYFGGKRRVADEVWRRFGDTPNFVEPFAGSLAILLARPHRPGLETVNDIDAYVCNFWRAVKDNPDEVAYWADWPVNELDQHARNGWLIDIADDHTNRLREDPHYYDARIAGWWVWGMSTWVGLGWARDRFNQRPSISRPGMGLHSPGGVRAPHLADAEAWSNRTREIMRELQDRLRRVRVLTGDWTRCVTPTALDAQSPCAIFLDPPYNQTHRRTGLYRTDTPVADDVRQWAIEQGENPKYRIALCGYEGEHAMPDNWSVYAWSSGGFVATSTSQSLRNRTRERIWFSPHCIQ